MYSSQGEEKNITLTIDRIWLDWWRDGNAHLPRGPPTNGKLRLEYGEVEEVVCSVLRPNIAGDAAEAVSVPVRGFALL